MKLHFESDLPYQAAAIEAVCDLFRGQELCRSVFTVTTQALADSDQQSFEGKQFTAEGGIGNALHLLVDEELSENLQKVQLRNGLQPSDPLKAKQALDFTVEMETGTGKTYVYLRTMFELSQRYGFTKFVVVVPSVAIKEGVNKTLQITREHFESLYPSAKGYEFFQYDSDRLGEVRNFATSPNIQIMVITVGAINKFGDEADLTTAADEVHNGYFSIDKKKVGGKTVEMVKDTSGSTAADDDTYNLIMRDKEKLLSFESPLKFVFSHSALKEGWDNPNVFQICNFSTRETERWRRQTIGRGLRLCVNQQGERLRGFEINTLTVIATESYEQFAEKLQKDYEDAGIDFGIVKQHVFSAISVEQENGEIAALGFEASKAVWTHLKAQGYITDKGKVQDAMKTALKDGTLVLPANFEAQRAQITGVLKKLSGKLEVKNADERKQIAVRKSVLVSPEFKALWDRIKHKTTYRVHFDNEKLIEKCIDALNDMPPVAKTRLQWRKAGIEIAKSGVGAIEKAGADTVTLNEADIELPDLLTELQDRTQLTRKTIARILTESTRLKEFKRNPQQFIELAADSINRCKRLALVDGIKYQRLGDDSYWAQELFEDPKNVLMGYLNENSARMNAEKSVYEHVAIDSAVEWEFADQLEKNKAVKVYAKLPSWFKVPTPLGSYNPDWAVVVVHQGAEQVYFVVETKSSLFRDELRSGEDGKIKCGAAHFNALAIDENPALFGKFTNLQDLLSFASDQH